MSVAQEPVAMPGNQDWQALLDSGADFEPYGGGGLLVPASVGIRPVTDPERFEAEVAELATASEAPLPAEPAAIEAVVALSDPAEVDLAQDRELKVADRRRRRRGPAESAESLRTRLAENRRVHAVQREDAQERRAQDVEHKIVLADVEARERAATRFHRERERDAEEADALAELYRRAGRSGARARIRAEIGRSAEMRALRVAKVGKITLWAGIPVLAAFGLWSTTGVQAGVVRLLHLEAGSPAWWASWFVEPALIAVVSLIIIGRHVLASSGGKTDWRATFAEWAALVLSLALNIFGGWAAAGGFLDGLGGALPHTIGPVGAAGTAFLIGLFTGYVADARPWEGAARLAELDLVPPPAPAGPADFRTAINRGKHGLGTAETSGLPDDVRMLLDDVRAAIEDGALPTDPSAYAIYKHVMGGKGDKARASKVAALVAGWRPVLRAV